MAAAGPPPKDARRLRARRSAARRARVRRRRLGLALAVAVAVLALAVGLAIGRGSHTHAHTPPRAPRAAGAAGGAAQPPGTSASAGKGAQAPARPGGSPETSQVRALIALGRPIYCAGPRGHEVALTFDDGPGPYTRLMLAKLHKHGVAATFFVVGRNIGLVAGATAREREQGAVGDHTFTHPLLTSLSPAQAEREIVSTQDALARSTGAPVFLFRPPYGGRDATIDRIAREHGLLQILWTVDSADSLGANYAQIERNVIGGLRPGAIILMHENHGQTVRAMLAIFAALQRKHLRAVSVPQLLSDDPPSAAQVRAGGLGCGVHPSARGGG